MHVQSSLFLSAPQGITSCHLVIIRGESYHLPFLLIHGRGAELLTPRTPMEASQCLFTCLRSQLLSQKLSMHACDTLNTNERHPLLKMSPVMPKSVVTHLTACPPPSCLTQSQRSVRCNRVTGTVNVAARKTDQKMDTIKKSLNLLLVYIPTQKNRSCFVLSDVL